MPFDKRKNVFISGSAYEYGRFGEENGRGFIRDLSKTLLKNGFKIISGFGSGVGNYVIEGALHGIYLEQKDKVTDQLKVYPFPSLNGENTLNGGIRLPLYGGTTLKGQAENIHTSYRDDIISQAGIAIFLFGNKLMDISVREADGMREEFEIAKSYKALLIPVGASGYISEKLWKDIVAHYDEYFDSRKKFEWYECLGNPAARPDELIDAIVKIALYE
jgi:hypothetical protein